MDILQNATNGGSGELWRSPPGGGFFKDVLASSVDYCSRLAAMADVRSNERRGEPSVVADDPFRSSPGMKEALAAGSERAINGEQSPSPFAKNASRE
jgi:hypothetical protein